MKLLLYYKQPYYAKISYKKDSKKEKMDTFCEYCKKQVHTKDNCLKLKGFPEWFNKKYGGASSLRWVLM